MTTVERSTSPVDAGTPRPGRRALRSVLWAALVVAFAVTWYRQGLPTDRLSLLSWVLAGLAVHCVGRGRRSLVRLLTDWLPLVALLLLYDLSRGMADTLGVAVHVTEPIAADRLLTGGELPTVWLQAHWQDPWWQVVASLVYSSHFVVTPVVLAVLWLRDRSRWVRYVRLVLALSVAGLVTYVLYPAAPPWLAADMGVIEPVRRISGLGWEVLGLPRAGALLTTGQGQVNPVAAVPSLHTAFAVLTCLALFPMARRLWQRVALVAYALVMPLVLVWSGEHYVVDTVLGAGYAAAVAVLVPLAVRAWSRWRSPAGLSAVPASVTPTTSSG
ncbi:phosphatase PAP2 family protein [Modestobacter sp. I12A-02628]|uniref:Phosphatase PAP2 family protein n=1 Tax=Goekera deserti TaxID=2497753 RepID=A0A7K3WD40_9ACTN|nr:phosphatase PAP2 family protein [Goekera deserti]MPQ96853.1 phosphatase PAP2 family protein [Goekera deserti]NDI46833.1 phosphatase PAP2 family protein [Goekera deserti]NEL54401.1 phosphatase PAP2 family protein [Goekera deserti]